jgi:hypothetical protein
MKFFAPHLVIAIIANIVTVNAHALEATGVVIVGSAQSTFEMGMKRVNAKALQADAAVFVAVGEASASLNEAFADLRKNDDYKNLDDKALAGAILEALAAN